MNTLILKLSFLGHIGIFLSSLGNVSGLKYTKNSRLIPLIYWAYILDMLSCYKGVIPFYRCNNASDIYRHHTGALLLITLALPSLFGFYSNNINSQLNKIISIGFVSSLNEAIMIYGTSNKLGKFTTGIELLFKMYLFSFNAIWNSYKKYRLLTQLEYKSSHIPLYLICVGGWSLYMSLYPKLLVKSMGKFKKLIKA